MKKFSALVYIGFAFTCCALFKAAKIKNRKMISLMLGFSDHALKYYNKANKV